MVGAINHGGGVDSGGAEHTPGPWEADFGASMAVEAYIMGDDNMVVAEVDSTRANARLIASAPDLHRLLTKSLCTLQALVSNMEESGEGVEEVAKAICDADTGMLCSYETLAQAAITSVLGTFDLEALKTLVGEIEEVRGRAA